MEKQLPEDEPGSIQWEGGDVNKGDEPEEGRDPHTTAVIDAQDEELAAEDQSKPSS